MAPRVGKNPANSESTLFKALTRLFSGPIVNYRSQSGRKIRRQHLDKFSSRFKSISGQQFKKSVYSPLDAIATEAIANQRRNERYVDFDQMEYEPVISSTIDIYADEMTTHSDLRPMLNVRCSNEEIKAILTILYDQVLNVQYNLFGWGRTMCKYGDFFLYLDIDDKYGIKAAIALPTAEIERLEGKDSTNPNYVQFQWNSAGMTFENWQICHFRVLGNDKYAPYGTSILEPARRIHRQIVLMEDAMMAYRVVRSSERRVFKIDVGGIPPQDVEQFMQKTVSQLKRHSVVDPSSGRVDLRYNPMSIEEDYFIPVRPGSVTEIESLAGAQNITAIDDIKYLRDKLFAALKIPAAYLSMGEEASEDKTTLAQKDIRFARTIQRLQRVIIAELTKIGIIHLYTLGFRGEDLLNFSLSLNNPSKIAELQELEHWKQKFDIAASATEGYFSRRWVMEHIFAMSHEEFMRNQREMYYDRKHDAAMQAVAEQAAAEGMAGALGDGDMLDALGGPEEMPAIDAGGEAADALGGDTPDTSSGPPAAGDESPLLAIPPGSRDAPRTYGRGERYYAKNGRNDKRTGSGPRIRSLKAKAGQKNSSGIRNVFPGAEINNLAKVTSISAGIAEHYREEPSSYKISEEEEEQRLFEVNNSVRDLLKSLKLKDLEEEPDLLEQKNENTA